MGGHDERADDNNAKNV
jgi:hypothetical protein